LPGKYGRPPLIPLHPVWLLCVALATFALLGLDIFVLGDTLARPYQPDDERPPTLDLSGPEQRDRVRDLN
jgi:hypothetical protein